jgi:hypothetical protein
LNNGLLDQAFDDVWNAKQTLTAAIGFVDSHSSHGLRAVGAIEQLLSDRFPTRTKPFWEFRDRNTVGPWGSTVGFHVLPSGFDVGWIDNAFHQRLTKVTQGWLLGVRRDGQSRSG